MKIVLLDFINRENNVLLVHLVNTKSKQAKHPAKNVMRVNIKICIQKPPVKHVPLLEEIVQNTVYCVLLEILMVDSLTTVRNALLVFFQITLAQLPVKIVQEVSFKIQKDNHLVHPVQKKQSPILQTVEHALRSGSDILSPVSI